MKKLMMIAAFAAGLVGLGNVQAAVITPSIGMRPYTVTQNGTTQDVAYLKTATVQDGAAVTISFMGPESGVQKPMSFFSNPQPYSLTIPANEVSGSIRVSLKSSSTSGTYRGSRMTITNYSFVKD
jgi:hypothetical protein